MTLLLIANNALLLASISVVSILRLPPSAYAAAGKSGQASHIRRHQYRRLDDEGGDDDESYLPSGPEHGEWYLPDLKVNIKKTWLFGAGDSSEWSGVTKDDDEDDNSTTDTAAANSMMPSLIEIPQLYAGEYVTDVSAGGVHSAILTNEGRILTAGSSSAGEARGLGRDTINGTELGFMPLEEVYPLDTTTDTGRSELPATKLPQFVKVAASQYYTFAIDDLGNVWSTGNNAYAQLGLNDTTSRDRFHQVSIPEEPNIFEQGAKRIIDVALGERHTLLLREDGKVFGCGWNQYGQLGIGVKGGNVLSLSEIAIDVPDPKMNGTENATTDGATILGDMQVNHEVITEVVAGRGSSYFLTSSGHVYATGTNYKGQLCLGHRDDRTLPTMLEGVETFLSSDEGVGLTSMASGASSLYLLLSNGLVLACGQNNQGQLGIGIDDTDSIDVPMAITNVTNATAVYSGPTSFGAYFVNNRTIYAVGFDGTGSRENWNVPNMMACVNEDTTLEKGIVVSSGNDHTLYLATVETTFECEGGESEDEVTVTPKISAQTAPPSLTPTTATPTTTPPTATPTITQKPTISHVPSMSPSESMQPSQTSMPTAAPTSGVPTTFTSSPDSTPSPTSISTEESTSETDAPTTFSMVGSDAPTVTSAPTAEGETKSPVGVTPQRTAPIPNNGACGYSLSAFGLTLLCVCSTWMWF